MELVRIHLEQVPVHLSAPDMLPTKPMGQPPAIWEVRHSDEEDQSKTEQHQQKNSSRSWKSKGEDSGVGIIVTEEDGILRSDHPISPCTTTSSTGKPEVRLRKPVNASNSTTAGSKFQVNFLVNQMVYIKTELCTSFHYLKHLLLLS